VLIIVFRVPYLPSQFVVSKEKLACSEHFPGPLDLFEVLADLRDFGSPDVRWQTLLLGEEKDLLECLSIVLMRVRLLSQHLDMFLVHARDLLDKGPPHVLLHLIDSVDRISSGHKLCTKCDQRTNLEPVECWTNVEEVFVDLIVVEIESLELGEVPRFQLLQMKFRRLHRQVIEVSLVWQPCISYLKESVLLRFYNLVHRCASSRVSIELIDLGYLALDDMRRVIFVDHMLD
jgi:hypothetical protein